MERRFSPLTVEAYGHDLEVFCAFLGVEPAEFVPSDVTEDDVKAWLTSLMDAGMNARTVRRKLSSLRSFFRYCRRIGVVGNNVTQRVIAPKTDKPLPVFYKESEMQKAQEAEAYADDFVSVRDSMVVELLYETGMRCAEVLGLDDKDVDYAAKQVRVFGKRRKERIIPVGDRLLEQILQYREWRDREAAPRTDDALLVSLSGKRLSAAMLRKIVHNRMSEVSTLKKQSPHVLRHTFATVMLNNGADIHTIQLLMGHASLAATQIYTHTTFEQVKKVYKNAHPRSTGSRSDTSEN